MCGAALSRQNAESHIPNRHRLRAEGDERERGIAWRIEAGVPLSGIMHETEAHPFPADLARALSLPKRITFLVKKLEESGYLGRMGEKGDLRRYRLRITPAGLKARDI
jgi:hypothetical protein